MLLEYCKLGHTCIQEPHYCGGYIVIHDGVTVMGWQYIYCIVTPCAYAPAGLSNHSVCQYCVLGTYSDPGHTVSPFFALK